MNVLIKKIEIQNKIIDKNLTKVIEESIQYINSEFVFILNYFSYKVIIDDIIFTINYNIENYNKDKNIKYINICNDNIDNLNSYFVALKTTLPLNFNKNLKIINEILITILILKIIFKNELSNIIL